MSTPPPKPKTYCGDLAHLSPALVPLTKHDCWVVWNWELRTNKDGTQKWTKPPFQVRYPSAKAESDQPQTWGPFDDALKLVLAQRVSGLGFTLLKCKIAAIDIDHVRDPESGLTTPSAEQLLEEAKALGCYIEITPSGTGYRIIGRAEGTRLQRRFNIDPKNDVAVELYRRCERYITVTALEVTQCNELPLIDEFIDKLLARYENGGGNGAEISGNLFDFNTAEKRQGLDYEDLIKHGAPPGGDRSDLFHSVVGHLYGQGLSEDEVIELLALYPQGIGAKYTKRLSTEVRRSYRKWKTQKQAQAGGQAPSGGAGGGTVPPLPPLGAQAGAQPGPQPGGPQPGPQPQPFPSIKIIAGELSRVVDEAESALLGSGRELYQRGGMIVRPVLSTLKAAHNRDTLGWRLVLLNSQHMIELMTRAARFLRFNERKKMFLPVDATPKIAETYLAREGMWKLPILTGIVNAPFLRVDGSLCDQPGYDPHSGLLFKSNGVSFPPIPSAATRDDALAALAELIKLIKTFPFITSADRSVMLSAFLTSLDRRAMAAVPMHAISSPVGGTGKSLLADLVSMLATGRTMPVTAQGKNDEELNKQLDALLISGAPLISLDNCERELGGDRLNQMITQETLNVRPLGHTEIVEALNTAMMLATGVNLTVHGTLTRRVLMSTIDAGIERPETRHFDLDVLAFARAERPHLVAAGLTVLRAWHNADQREEGAKFDQALGSFPDWEQRIRQTLVWLGQADPCETINDLRKGDPERLELYAVMEQWRQKLGLEKLFPLQRVIDHANYDAGFHAALIAVASGPSGISNVKLGRWLRRVEGKIISSFRFRQDGMRDGYPLWGLFKT